MAPNPRATISAVAFIVLQQSFVISGKLVSGGSCELHRLHEHSGCAFRGTLAAAMSIAQSIRSAASGTGFPAMTAQENLRMHWTTCHDMDRRFEPRPGETLRIESSSFVAGQVVRPEVRAQSARIPSAACANHGGGQ